LSGEDVFGVIRNDVGEGEEKISVIVFGQLKDLCFCVSSLLVVVSSIEGCIDDILDLLHLFEALSL
jgi:hypothetical protein